MERAEISQQLWDLPIAASVALALRVGLRVLPWLALSEEKKALEGWPIEKRAQHLLAIWLAYDAALLRVVDSQANGLRQAARATRAAAVVAANAAGTHGAVDAAADMACAATNDDDSASANTTADAATTAAAVAAACHFSLEFDLNLKHDLEILRKSGEKALIESPLWTAEAPTPWLQQLAQFQLAVRSVGCGFEFWLDWYAARCRGNAIDVGVLQHRVFLPESIARQSPTEINAWLASLASAPLAPLNRVRTIFIGDGEAGKTSLIRVLHGEPVVEGIEAKTPGIEIREWPVPGTDIKASFWDFGGQVMVHATHQLFLRESCLYVLLVSAREKEKATERAEYWLEHVKSFGKGAPVLIVANKADKEPVRLDESLLLEKYPGMIQGFFQLACTEAQGAFRNQFEQFRQVFCQQLQAVGLHQVQFQKAHFAVLQNLRERTSNQAFLTHQDYEALCAEHRVDEHGALNSAWLLDILDKLGVIIHFPEMVEMDEYILNPRWLTYGVYTLMYNQQARITRAQAVALLAAKPVTDQFGNQLSYPASKCRIVFEAMRHYKLCYFLPDDPNQIIIPALLPSDIRQHGFDTASALEFHYQFESFLPRHLISEFIVECHADIANKDGQDVVWQHGVLLDSATHQTRALIQADYHFRRLNIWLTPGPRMADMLAALRDRIERIVARMDIRYAQKIRLPRMALLETGIQPLDAEWADFKQILALRNRQQTTYYHSSGSEYSIGKVLGLFESPKNYRTITPLFVTHSILGDVTVANSIASSFNNIQATEIKPIYKGLKSLSIKNFRTLADCTVSQLGRVNLIVGKNNAGKSSILEALRIYAGFGQEPLLQEIAVEHDEPNKLEGRLDSELPETLPYQGFFTGWRLPSGDETGIVIGEKDDEVSCLSINVLFDFADAETGNGRWERSGHELPIHLLQNLPLNKVRLKPFVKKGGKPALPAQFAELVKYQSDDSYTLCEAIPCSVVPTRFVSFDELGDEFDKISLTDKETILNDALRLIAPEFEKLSFVALAGNDKRPQGSVRRTAIVRLTGIPHPVPINSMGDGILRILQLILKVFPAEGGFLLIDEFENGLHYSVQEKVWRLVFDLAEKLNIQVFATTHSWDCITHFAKVAQERKDDDGVLFRVGRSVRTSDKGKVIATVFSGSRLFDLTQADIEVR